MEAASEAAFSFVQPTPQTPSGFKPFVVEASRKPALRRRDAPSRAPARLKDRHEELQNRPVDSGAEHAKL